MFSFKKWQIWLQDRAEELKTDGLEAVSCRHGPDDLPKPKTILEIMSGPVYGGFENWKTGETDYTILDNSIIGDHGRPKMVTHKWGLIVTDESFELVYNEFIAAFRNYLSAK